MPNPYFNQDPFAGGVMDAPDATVRLAMLKLANPNAMPPMSQEEAQRLSNRMYLEQQSHNLAMKQGQMDVARGFNTPNAQTYLANTQQPSTPRQQIIAQLMQQPQATQPAPFSPRNLPGKGEMVEVNGVPIYGGGVDANTPRPAEGYGYVGGISPITGEPVYLSTTPQGQYTGSVPISGPQDLPNQQAPVAASKVVNAPATKSALEQLLSQPSIPLASLLSNISAQKTATTVVPANVLMNEKVADTIRSIGYGVSNLFRPSAWTGDWSGMAFTPEKSPAYQEQISSRLGALTAQNSPVAQALKQQMRVAPSPAALSNVDLFGGLPAKQTQTAAPTASTPMIGLPSDREIAEGSPYANMGVEQSALPITAQQIPQPVPAVAQQTQQPAAQSFAQPAMPTMQAPQAYTPGQLNLHAYNPPGIAGSATRALQAQQYDKMYQAQTQAAVNQYKAIEGARQQAVKLQSQQVKDAVSTALNTARIGETQAKAEAARIANEFAKKGGQIGVQTIKDSSGKEHQYVLAQNSVGRFTMTKLDEARTAEQKNIEDKARRTSEVIGLIKSGNEDAAMAQFFAMHPTNQLTGAPTSREDYENWAGGFRQNTGVPTAPAAPTAQKKQPAATQPSTAKPVPTARNAQGQVMEYRNGKWSLVK